MKRERMPRGTGVRVKATKPGHRMQRDQRFILISPSRRAFSGTLVAREGEWAIFRRVR